LGQPAVQLPEPATPPADVSVNADDLLSKLAGDEVEKLLSDADVAPPATAASAAAGATSSAAIETPAPPAAPAVASSEPVGTDSARPGAAEAAVQAELDTLFNELTAGEGKASTAAPPAQPAVPATLDAPAQPKPPVSEAPAEPATAAATVPPEPDPGSTADAEVDPDFSGAVEPAAADVSQLEAQLQQTLAAPAEPAPATKPAASAAPQAAAAPAESKPEEPEAETSWWLRPLELLSAPLGDNPQIRETVGKIAIVTAFNAIVVLIYVLLFRG